MGAIIGNNLRILKVLSNELNIRIMSILKISPLYPREIAKILSKDESEISRRLKALEKLGLVKGEWHRIGNKNVKIYRSLVGKLSIVFDSSGAKIIIENNPDGKVNSMDLVKALEGINEIPDTKFFVGRRQELNLMLNTDKSTIVIWGIAGSGKTYLAAKYAKLLGRPTLWYSSTSISNVNHFIWRIALFLSKLGERKTSEMIVSSTNKVELALIIDMLINCLEKVGALIVIDDYHVINDKKLKAVISYFADKFRKAKLLIVSRKRPIGLPYNEGKILEMPLKGLEPNDAKELFKLHNVSLKPETIAKVLQITNSYPALLVMYAELIKNIGEDKVWDKTVKQNVVKYLIREIYETLTNTERSIIKALMIFEDAVPPQVITKVIGKQNIEHALASLLDKGLVETIGTRYRAHNILRLLFPRTSERK